MNHRLRLVLSQDEFAALIALSVSELRMPADQARLILRQELERCGLLEQNCDHHFSVVKCKQDEQHIGVDPLAGLG